MVESRTTEAAVRKIIDVDNSITDLDPFLRAAHILVEDQCEGIVEEVAVEVETWLAAHFVTIRDMRSAKESVSSLSQAFQYKIDLGLSCSMYGQTAMNLDLTGGLARWNIQTIKGKAGAARKISWLGTGAT